MRSHIIPQFILRGYSINPDASKNKQKIMVYSKDKVKTIRINISHQQKDFYSGDLEKKLGKEYETIVAPIFKSLSNLAQTEKTIQIKKQDYELLAKFHVHMWRRSDVQLEKVKTQITNMIDLSRDKLLSKYKNVSADDIAEEGLKNYKHLLYDSAIESISLSDDVVNKHLTWYDPQIIKNETSINFPLHNLYATTIYNDTFNYNPEYPDILFEPIDSKTIAVFYRRSTPRDKTESNVKFDIEKIKSEETIKEIIRLYIIKNATQIVVDNTNSKLVEQIHKEKQNG